MVDLDPRPSVAIEATAYFVVAEGRTNATKHTATRLAFRIRDCRENIVVEMEDNGVGVEGGTAFDPEVSSAADGSPPGRSALRADTEGMRGSR